MILIIIPVVLKLFLIGLLLFQVLFFAQKVNHRLQVVVLSNIIICINFCNRYFSTKILFVKFFHGLILHYLKNLELFLIVTLLFYSF